MPFASSRKLEAYATFEIKGLKFDIGYMSIGSIRVILNEEDTPTASTEIIDGGMTYVYSLDANHFTQYFKQSLPNAPLSRATLSDRDFAYLPHNCSRGSYHDATRFRGGRYVSNHFRD